MTRYYTLRSSSDNFQNQIVLRALLAEQELPIWALLYFRTILAPFELVLEKTFFQTKLINLLMRALRKVFWKELLRSLCTLDAVIGLYSQQS